MNLKKIINKKILIISLIIISLIIISSIIYNTFYLDYISNIELKLIGEDVITLNLDEEYKEQGAIAKFRNKDISKMIKINKNINNKKIGQYLVDYKIKYKNKTSKITRIVKIIDNIPPLITLNGKEKISLYEGEEYNEEGAVANDNYDGDISSKIEIKNNLDINKEGNYEIIYNVSDTSGNMSSITRIVEVKKKKIITQTINLEPGVAVLNYHFFYSDGENCGQGICLNTRIFEEQLKYLNDNGYKTLTMDEFVKWIYGEIDIPNKSVLLTIDDGALGTGFHNGNKLIPLLEKYQVHATLFLITGWWSIDNYKSEYLDIESHSNDMHTEGICSGVTRGAKMLCLDHDQVLEDLKASILVTGSNKAFCYPFYAYNENAISLVKEAGFKVAFVGGGYKATRNVNKYAIPRYAIKDGISLDTFVNYIS